MAPYARSFHAVIAEQRTKQRICYLASCPTAKGTSGHLCEPSLANNWNGSHCSREEECSTSSCAGMENANNRGLLFPQALIATIFNVCIVVVTVRKYTVSNYC